MKVFRTIGIKCPVCGHERLRVLYVGAGKVKGLKGKLNMTYTVSCLPEDNANVSPCSRVWGAGGTETEALAVALTNMVQQLDANMRVRHGACSHIVSSLLKQLQLEETPPTQDPQ